MTLASCSSVSLPSDPGDFTNSLGMVFQQLPQHKGTCSLAMCVHETRERDLAVFRHPSSRPPDHAATQVTWHEARDFCEWLTLKERSAGLISQRSRYRLPTDSEWSMAAGILHLEHSGTPEDKDGCVPGRWAWGTSWPPSANAANCLGSEGSEIMDSAPIPAFRDRDATVGHALHYYEARLGFCSLTGNVWEWCKDEFRPGTDWRVLRGGSWKNNRPESLLLSHRTHDPSTYKSDSVGFRVVLERAP